MTISERLFDEIERRGLTAYALSKHLQIGTTTTTNWKQRKTDPPAKYIAPICEFLDCSLEYLLTGHETEKTPVPEISENGRKMLELFDQLSGSDQLILIGRMHEMVSPMLEEKKGHASSEDQAV